MARPAEAGGGPWGAAAMSCRLLSLTSPSRLRWVLGHINATLGGGGSSRIGRVGGHMPLSEPVTVGQWETPEAIGAFRPRAGSRLLSIVKEPRSTNLSVNTVSGPSGPG